MDPVRFDDARQFYAAVRLAFAAREVEHSLFLGIARRLAETGEPGLMFALQSAGVILAAALRTPPFQLSICAADPSAIEPLAAAAHAIDPGLPAVVGLETTATRFAEHWSTRTGQAWRVEHDMTFYALRTVAPPPAPAPGALRLATPADVAWLAEWRADFAEEVGLAARERGVDHALVVTQTKIRRAEQLVWEDGGRPVSTVAFTPTGVSGARVGPVMTTPAARRRGYASAAVAALSQRLLDGGYAWCGLFADVLNPASNRIYRRLGYSEACRYRSIELQAPPGTCGA